MALQHHQFKLRLRDDERLRLYVQAGMVEREMQSVSLKQVELACRSLELEAKESPEKAARAKAERDAACHEVAMAKLTAEGALNTRAQVESELAWVQHALGLTEEARWKAEFDRGAAQEVLATTGEACKKAEEENSQLAEENLAFIIELGAIKDEFVAFREKAAVEKEMMEATFGSSGDTLFNYDYGCCAFVHNICGSKPEISDGMPNPSVLLTANFFVNPRCPLGALVATSSLDPAIISEGDRSVNSPSAAGVEVVIPMEQEEGALVTDPPAK